MTRGFDMLGFPLPMHSQFPKSVLSLAAGFPECCSELLLLGVFFLLVLHCLPWQLGAVADLAVTASAAEPAPSDSSSSFVPSMVLALLAIGATAVLVLAVRHHLRYNIGPRSRVKYSALSTSDTELPFEDGSGTGLSRTRISGPSNGGATGSRLPQ